MSVKCKATSTSEIQVKNCERQPALKISYVISHLEKGKKIVDICCNVRLAHSSVRTICDNVDGIKESAKCLDNIKCQQSETGSVYLYSKTTTVLSE
jgi:hypothetical protein